MVEIDRSFAVDSPPDPNALRTANVWNDIKLGAPVVRANDANTKLPHVELVEQKESPALADSRVAAERERLLKEFDKHATPEQAAAFRKDVRALEDRFGGMVDMYKRQGLSEKDAKAKASKEYLQTYKSLKEFAAVPDLDCTTPITGEERFRVALQLMHQIAVPTDISQGYHKTCNVTTVEVRTAMRRPHLYVSMVASIATNGEFTAADGTKVPLTKQSLRPDDESKAAQPVDGQRSLASQYFQVGAVNLYYQKHMPSVVYEQGTKDGTRPEDTGERLEARIPVPFVPVAQLLKRGPNLSADEIVEIGNALSGESDKRWYIRVPDSDTKGSTISVRTERELQQQLELAKREGRLPITIEIHTGSNPFFGDSGAGAAGGSGGGHVVNVVDYYPGTPPRITIDNQWDTASDHLNAKAISVHQLFLGMRNTADPYVDIEYKRQQLLQLRRDHTGHQVSERDYEALLKASIDGAGATIAVQPADRVNEPGFVASRDDTKRMLREMINELPPSQRAKFIQQMWNSKLISDDECASWMVKTCKQNGLTPGSPDVQPAYNALPDNIKQSIQKALHPPPRPAPTRSAIQRFSDLL